jgi:hypothetical protein
MSIGIVKVKKIEYFISMNRVKNQEWLWEFLSRNENNLKNSIRYWAGFLIKTWDCIPTFKCIEPPDPPHTHCSLTFKKPGPNLLFEISNFHRPGTVLDFKKTILKPGPDYYQKNYIPAPTLVCTVGGDALNPSKGCSANYLELSLVKI